MRANASVSTVKSTSNLTIEATPPTLPHCHDSALTERQQRRIFEKAIVKRGFEGNITIDSDPREATRYTYLEYLNASHWGDKDSRMVFWAKGSIVGVGLSVTSGLGIVSQTSPNPDQWV